MRRNPLWSQPEWHFDFSNRTGLARDDNSGADALHPLLSWNGGFLPKMDTRAPILSVPHVLMNFLSSSPLAGTDPIIFEPVLSQNCELRLQSDFGGFQKVGSGVLAGVTLKDYVAGTLTKADLGPGADINLAVVNTTLGKESLAWTRANLGGTLFSLSQSLTRFSAPYMHVPPTYVDNWANGDTFDLYRPTSVHLARLTPDFADTTAKCYVQQLGISKYSGTPACIMGQGVYMNETRCDRLLTWDRPGWTRSSIITNCIFTDPVGITGGAMNTGIVVLVVEPPFPRFWGGFGAVNLTGGLLDGNFIVIPITTTAPTASSIKGCVLADVYLESGLLSEGRSSTNQYDFTGPHLWGPGLLQVDDGRMSIYGGKAQDVLLLKGGVTLAGSSIGFTIDPATGAITTGVAVTPSNIDTFSTPNGVGLFIPGGASVGVGAGI